MTVDLLPYQNAGVAFLGRNARALLADDMGLGKSVQALRAVDQARAYPCLIVCRATGKYNWVAEVNKWLPGRRSVVLSAGERKSVAGVDFVIINYDILSRYVDRIASSPCASVIFDEAHALKNADSQRSKAAAGLVDGKRVILLTGTPIQNRPAELLNLLRLLDKTHIVGGPDRYLDRYCERTLRMIRLRGGRTRRIWDVSGAAHLDELHRLLRVSNVMLRRTKQSVLSQLPPLRRTAIELDCDLGEYRKAEADFIAWLRSIGGNWRRALRAEALSRTANLRRLALEAKLPLIRQWIEEALEAGTKLVVFADSRAAQHRLFEEFPAAARLRAEDAAAVRMAAVEAFQADPKVSLFIASLRAGGESINLTAASAVAFVDLVWEPMVHRQAEDRLNRMGQRNAVSAYYLLAQGTIDQRLFDVLDRKFGIASTITDGAALALDAVVMSYSA